MRWYFDTPYAIRQPEARKYLRLPPSLQRKSENISAHFNAKIEACAAYRSQINFQFGNRPNLEKSLKSFHFQSKEDLADDVFVENFLVESHKKE